jgi:hypothetical protein
MELPLEQESGTAPQTLDIEHPGGLGDILRVADGGSWLRGVIRDPQISASDVQYVAIA